MEENEDTVDGQESQGQKQPPIKTIAPQDLDGSEEDETTSEAETSEGQGHSEIDSGPQPVSHTSTNLDTDTDDDETTEAMGDQMRSLMIKKSTSLENLEAFCDDGFDDQAHSTDHTSKEKLVKPTKAPGMTPEDTWDYSLKSVHENMSAQTIWIADREVVRKLGHQNAFGECEHDVMKINCPCPQACKYSICSRCHIVFCSNSCIKYSKDMAAGKEPKPKVESETIKVDSGNTHLDVSDGKAKKNTSKDNALQKTENLQPSRPDISMDSTKPKMRRTQTNYTNPPLHNQNQSPNPKAGLMPTPNGATNVFYPVPAVPVAGLNYSNIQNQQFMTQGSNMPTMMGNGMPILMPFGQYGSYPTSFPTNFATQPQFPFQGNNFPGNMVPMQVIKNLATSSRHSVPQMPMQPSGVRSNPRMPGPNRNFETSGVDSMPPKPASPTYSSVPKEEPVMILRDPGNRMKGHLGPSNSPNMQQNTFVRTTVDPKISTDNFSNFAGRNKNISQSNSPEKNREGMTQRHKQHFMKPKPTENSNISRPNETVKIKQDPFLCLGVPMTVSYLSGYSIFDISVSNAFGEHTNKRINETIEKMNFFKPHKNIRKDAYCLGIYSSPENGNKIEWYRGRVLKLEEQDSVQVYFIDYGNVETLKASKVAEIPADLMKERPCSFRISIGDFKKFENTTEEMLQASLIKFLVDSLFRVTIFQPGEPDGCSETLLYKAKIEISHEGQWLNLTEILVADGFGVKCKFIADADSQNCAAENLPEFTNINTDIPVKMGHVDSFSNFNVLPLNCAKKRDYLMAKLNDRSPKLNFPISMWALAGYLGIAKRSDGRWARCKITAIPKEVAAEVRFIDFGDTVIVQLPDLKTLPKDLFDMPQLAYRCCLSIFPCTGIWNDEAEEIIQMLKETTVSDDVNIVVYTREPELETHIVEVFLKNTSIGISKSLLLHDKEVYRKIYEVDLNIMKKLRQQEKEKNISSRSLAVASDEEVDKRRHMSTSTTSSGSEISNTKRKESLLGAYDEDIGSRRPPKPSPIPIDKFMEWNSKFETGSTRGDNVDIKTVRTTKTEQVREPSELRSETESPGRSVERKAVTASPLRPKPVSHHMNRTDELQRRPVAEFSSDAETRSPYNHGELDGIKPLKSSKIPIGEVKAFFSENRNEGVRHGLETPFRKIIDSVAQFEVGKDAIDSKPIKTSSILIRGQGQHSSENDYPFTVDQIQPAANLHSLDKTTVFEIKHIFSFNRFYIIPTTIKSDEFMRLQDEITDCLSPNAKFDKFPQVGSVVVAPYSDDNYYRATINNLISGEKAKVQLIDLGYEIEVNLSEIKPANESVMRYSCRGYEVILAGIDESSELLLWADFMEFMEISRKRRYLIRSCIGTGDPYTVSLVMSNSLMPAILSDLILKKQVWQWEKVYEKGFHTDIELIENGGWSSPAKINGVKIHALPLEVELEAEITRFSSEGELWLVNVKERAYCMSVERDRKVLQNQIKRYAEKVNPSQFYPMLNEAVLIFLSDVPELRALNLRGIGRWNRCYREEHELWYRNLDLDEIYPFNSDLDIYFEVRKFCPEFFRIPLGIAECAIEGFKPSEAALQIVKEHFKPGTRIRFIAHSFDEETSIHSITCRELDQRISQLSTGRTSRPSP